MTDWKNKQALEKLRQEIIDNPDIPNELQYKLVRRIDTEIQREFECATRCTLKPDTVIKMEPLEYEVWE